MIAVITILFLLNINLWVRYLEIKEEVKRTEKICESLFDQLIEEPDEDSCVKQSQIDELIDRIEALEKSDYPKFDDALNEGLQNLLNYNFDVAKGGNK